MTMSIRWILLLLSLLLPAIIARAELRVVWPTHSIQAFLTAP